MVVIWPLTLRSNAGMHTCTQWQKPMFAWRTLLSNAVNMGCAIK